ncbi:MAG: D-2-hydroxyacid dehydrogenase [Rubricoccaceae bacterium]
MALAFPGSFSLTMPTLLVCLSEIQLADLDRVRELADGFKVVRAESEEDIRSLLGDVEIVIGYLPPALVSVAPRLQWIQSWSAGLDWLVEHEDFDPTGHPDLAVTSASGVHAVPIGEHVFAVLLAFSRKLPWALRDQRDRRWGPGEDYADVFEWRGKRLVMIGAGAIGERVIHLASAFGMTSVAVRASGRETPGALRTVTPNRMTDELAEADVVVAALPLTDATYRMLDAETFSTMKPGAVFVNVGRGETVDQYDLVDALESGQVGAAGLDVFEDEPLPASSPLWTMDNVIVTPHVAGDTPHYAERALDLFADNVARWRSGCDLRNRVDLQAGY